MTRGMKIAAVFGLSTFLGANVGFAQSTANMTTTYTENGRFKTVVELDSGAKKQCVCRLRATISYNGTQVAEKLIGVRTLKKKKKKCTFSASGVSAVQLDANGNNPVVTTQVATTNCGNGAVTSNTDAFFAVCGKNTKQFKPTKFLNDLRDRLLQD